MLQEAIKEAYAVAPTDVLIIETIEFVKGDEHLYMVQQPEAMTLGLESGETKTFEAVPFSFNLPESGENGRQELHITVDNVDQKITEFVQQVSENPDPISVIYRPYLSTDLSSPQLDPPLRLTLDHISVDVLQVKARASFGDVINKPFPNETYTRARFPSLGN